MKKILWLLIIIGAVYYGYNNYWSQETPPNKNIDTIDEEITINASVWQTHKNNSYANYSIQYPGNWTINSTESQTTFTSPDELDNVVINLGGDKTIDGTQTIKEINGQQILVIEGEDPDDGSPAKFYIYNLSNDEKLEIRGFGSIFDKMIDTLVINSQQPAIAEPTDEPEKEELSEDEKSTEQEEAAEKEPKAEPVDEPTKNSEQNQGEEDFVVKVFYQNDPGDSCSKVIGLAKEIDTRYNTDEVNALVTLTLGLNSEEVAAGYTTSIPPSTRLRNLSITGGVATADFNAILNEGGGSCIVTARRAQITETLMQFPNIEQVIITVDGDAETALQP